MKRTIQIIVLLMTVGLVHGQEVYKRLQSAVKNLQGDEQLKSGVLAFSVGDQKTGNIVFSENGTTGLPAGSTQKVFTSIASLETLKGDYRYKTTLAYSGNIVDGILNGNLMIDGAGDPTLGSWRYSDTKEQVILNRWIKAIKQAGIRRINGDIIISNSWGSYTVPGGWIWDDIGNYYGAGATNVNWRENQYDLKLKSGSTGSKVAVVATNPPLYDVNLVSELTAGKAGSGDNAYIYLGPYSTVGYVRGTIPPIENSFTVSGSFPDPAHQLKRVLEEELKKQGIEFTYDSGDKNMQTQIVTNIDSHLSPPLDSINYWFLKKSINLYGEALAKTLGYERKKEGSTETGVDIIKTFWKERGVDQTSINIKDGSGLSPQNRITAEALVKAMQYARSQTYFNSFYNALPEFNGIKMKSGTVGGVKSFTGYVNGYTFAIIASNYNGSASEIVRKMYRILDLLK